MTRILSDRDRAIAAAARTGCALFGRDDLLALRIQGGDRVRFLHNMLTQDIKGLATPGVARACWCDAQGAVLALVHVVQSEAHIALWTARDQAAALCEGLDRYVIADDVEVVIDDDLALVEAIGPAAEAISARLGVGAGVWVGEAAGCAVVSWHATAGGGAESPRGVALPSVLMQCDRAQLPALAAAWMAEGAQPGSHAAREALRVAEGEARVGHDFAHGSLPVEIGRPEAVSFRKGCYLGQEAIAMMQYRGQPRRHLCWVAAADPTAAPGPGAPLYTTLGRKAGTMGSAVWDGDGWLGLAMVQRKALVPDALLCSDPAGLPVLRVVATTVPGALAPVERKTEAP